jgi:general secretion pathway protein F
MAAGLPLERALVSQAAEAESAKLKSLLEAIRTGVAGGETLASTLAAYPRDFSDIYRAMIAAGEETGSMATVLQRLANWLEARQALRAKLTQACVYPVIVVAVAVVVVGALLTFVVPQVVGVFASARQKLPPLTSITLALSYFLRAYWLPITVAAIAGVWLAFAALRQPLVRRRFDQWVLGVPIIGQLVRDTNAARFGATLGALAGAGVPILKALQAAAQTLSNQAMRADAERAQGGVREGGGIARTLGEHGRFPPSLITFIGLGEQTGQLADMADRAAARLAASVERRVVWLVSLLEPALILAMGVMVLLIVLAVLLPIIQLNTLVR